MSLFGKIDFNSLSETDRAIYQYLNSHGDKAFYMRVRELADASHTSASSVMRFIRKMGFESYAQFRASLKSQSTAEETVDTFSQGTLLLDPKNFPKDMGQRLKVVANLIYEAENIIFFGMGASGSLCEYAARRMATIGYNSFALTDPTYPIAQKLRNTFQNVIIVLSITGKTTELVETVNNFKNHDDYTTVAITSNEQSLLAALCQYTLSYQVQVRHFDTFNDLTSQIPAMYLLESLIGEVEKLEK